MKVFVSKAKEMVIAGETKQLNMSIEGQMVEQVKEFKYLCATIQDTGGLEIEINQRIERAARLYHALNKALISIKEVTTETKTIAFNSISR